MKNSSGKIWRVIAIVFMGLTAAMNILGGAGTSCAAFFTKQYPPMWALYDYRWLYQLLVVTTVAAGIAGIAFTVALARGRKHAFRNALILLAVGTALGAVQYFASLALRGKAIPANMKLYANLVTLVIFLVIALPGIRSKVGFDRAGGGAGATGAGLAAILAGLTILTTPMWAASSHTYLGDNWVFVLGTPLLASGGGLLLIGLVLLIRAALRGSVAEVPAVRVEG